MVYYEVLLVELLKKPGIKGNIKTRKHSNIHAEVKDGYSKSLFSSRLGLGLAKLAASLGPINYL